MSYTPTNWENLPSTNSPVNRTNLQNIENGISELHSITVGQGTINNSYISASERNNYDKGGKVVCYAFTLTATGTWDNTTKFISNLPKPRSQVRFMGINSTTYMPMRFNLTTDGEIQNAYSDNPPSNGNIIEGQITYITID